MGTSDPIDAGGSIEVELASSSSHAPDVVNEIDGACSNRRLDTDKGGHCMGPIPGEVDATSPISQASTTLQRRDGDYADPVRGNLPDPRRTPAVAVEQAGEALATQTEKIRYVEVNNHDNTGWAAMTKTVRDYDEEKVKYCKEDIDTLLVFAGLYSAVLSAFIIESYQYLQPDSGDQMVYLFQQMLAQNYSMTPGFLNSTNPRPSLPSFEAPSWAVRVNILWFSSLVISLAAASYGMLVKQWLREYLDMEHTSPQERLRARQYRRPALDSWKVFEIAASLPLLLELALALFFVGLCYFTTAIHLSISRSTIPFVAGWAFFFLLSTLAPLVSPRCPFKTTLLRGVMRQGRRVVSLLAEVSIVASCAGKKRNECLSRLKGYMQEEVEALLGQQDDLAILRSVESIMPGDGLLPTVVEVARGLGLAVPKALSFILEIIGHRTGLTFRIDLEESDIVGQDILTVNASPGHLDEPAEDDTWENLVSPQVYGSLTLLASDVLQTCANFSHPWSPGHFNLAACACRVFIFLIARRDPPLPPSSENGFHHLIFSFAELFPLKSYLENPDARWLRAKAQEALSTVPNFTISPTPTQFDAISDSLEILVKSSSKLLDARHSVEPWAKNVLMFLTSQWKHCHQHAASNSSHSPFSIPFVFELLQRIHPYHYSIPFREVDEILRLDIYYGILLGLIVTPWNSIGRLRRRKFYAIPLRDVLSIIPRILKTDRKNPLYDELLQHVHAIASSEELWSEKIYDWLRSGRMPGNGLVDIVRLIFAASDREGQRRKVQALVDLCHINISLENTNNDKFPEFDFANLLLVVADLHYLNDPDKNLSAPLSELRHALRKATSSRLMSYKFLMALLHRTGLHNQEVRLRQRMQRERLLLAHCLYHAFLPGEKGKLEITRQAFSTYRFWEMHREEMTDHFISEVSATDTDGLYDTEIQAS